MGIKDNIRFIIFIVLLSFSTGASLAQENDHLIEYGSEITATITTRKFEDLYTFEGEAGDIVVIEMVAANDSSIDPQVFFATIDNDLLASNDDAFGRDSRVIYRLPKDGTYLIVATRLSGRFGTDEGDYQLRLTKVEPLAAGVTHEGSENSQESPQVVIFAPDVAGQYTVNYRHIRGDYYPALTIASFSPESTYAREVGRLDGMELESGTLTFMFEADVLYSLSLAQSNYKYSSDHETVIYTLWLEKDE